MITTSVVDEYEELRALNIALMDGLARTAEPLDAMVAAVGLVMLHTLLPLVPVDTGTLQISQTFVPQEGKGEAWITSAHLQNPKRGGYADQYVLDVLDSHGDFYELAVQDTPEWVEEAFGAFEVWAGELL